MADPKKRLPLLPLLLVVSLAGVAGEQPSVDDVMRTVQAAVGSGGKAPPRDVLQKFQNRVKQLSDGLEAAGGAPLAYDVDLADPAAHQHLLGMIREGTRRMEELKAAACHEGREIEDPPRKTPRGDQPIKTPRTNRRRYVRPPKPGKAANKDEEEEMSPDEIIAFLETELDKQTKLAEAFRTAPSQCADYAELNGASEEKVAALEADAGKLGRENRDLRQQLGRLEADKDRLTKQVRNLEEDVDQARHDAKWYETEMGRLVMDIKLAGDVHKEDRKEIKQLKKDKATAFAAKKDLKQQLSEAASQLNRTRIERDFLQKENSALQGSIDSCEARLDGIMEQVNSVKSGDADRTKYKEAVTKLHQCTQDFGRCSMTNSYLNAKSEAMDQWKAQYEREIKALASLGGCSPDLQLNHTKCKQANADLQAQVRGLSDRFTDARKAASDCQSELKENKQPRDAIVEELKQKTEYYKKGLEEAKGVQERYAKCVQQNKAFDTLEQDYQKCMAGQTSGPVEGAGEVADGDLRARLEECQASRQAMVEVGDRYHTCVRRRVELMDVEEKYAACVREKADVERRVDADGMVRDEYNTCIEKRKALERERREFDEKIAACQKLEAECSAAECPAPTPAPCDCGAALQKCEGDARHAADMYVDCKKTRQGFKVSRYFVKKENAMLKANVTRLEAELAAAEVRLLELQADGGATPGGADSGCAGSLQVCQQMLQALAQQKVHVEAAHPGEDKDTLRQEQLETAQAEAATCQSSLSVAQTMMKNLALQSGIPGAEKIPGQATGADAGALKDLTAERDNLQEQLETAQAESATCQSSLSVAQTMMKNLALQSGIPGAENIPREAGADAGALKDLAAERDNLQEQLETAQAEAATCQSSLSVAQTMMKNLALQSGIPGAENIPREAGSDPAALKAVTGERDALSQKLEQAEAEAATCQSSLSVAQTMMKNLALQSGIPGAENIPREAGADAGALKDLAAERDNLQEQLETAQAEAATCQSSLSVAQTMMKNLALQSGIPGAEKIPGQATGSAELEAAEAEAAACRSSLAVAQNMVKSLALQAGVQGAGSIPTEGGSDEALKALKAVTGERDELWQKLETAQAESATCQSSLSVAQTMMKNLALQSGIPGAENIPREAGETPPVPELYNPEDAAPVPELYPEGGCSPEQLEQVTDERNNCVETMKISQGKLGACSGDLAGVRARAAELEAGYSGCMEQLAEAQAKQQQAEFLKNGMEMIVSKQDENDKEAKEKYEKIARRAKRAEIYFRKYFYPVLGALLLLLAYNIFQFIRWRYDVSVEAAQLAKQRAREEKKKKK